MNYDLIGLQLSMVTLVVCALVLISIFLYEWLSPRYICHFCEIKIRQ